MSTPAVEYNPQRISSHNVATPNAILRISRDITLKDCLLLGPPGEHGSGDPYKETRVDLCLNLPAGWSIGLSRGMSWEVWDATKHHVQLPNWFRASGCKWVVYVVTGSPSYMADAGYRPFSSLCRLLHLSLSLDAQDRAVNVARTIAGLAGSPSIRAAHLAEALAYTYQAGRM